MSRYFNPDAPPETQEKKKQIKVRFKTQQDLIDFINKTGLSVSKQENKFEFPPKRSLDDFM